jgi:hypothetical protein
MNHDLGPVVSLNGHDLKQVAGPIGTEVQDLAVIVLACRDRVFDCCSISRSLMPCLWADS